MQVWFYWVSIKHFYWNLEFFLTKRRQLARKKTGEGGRGGEGRGGGVEGEGRGSQEKQKCFIYTPLICPLIKYQPQEPFEQ